METTLHHLADLTTYETALQFAYLAGSALAEAGQPYRQPTDADAALWGAADGLDRNLLDFHRMGFCEEVE